MTENKGTYSNFYYRLENSRGKTLKGYTVEEHVTTILDRGYQIEDTTSDGTFQPSLEGYSMDTVGLSGALGLGTYMDYRVMQWFTVQYNGQRYDLTTKFEHITRVDNGNTSNYVVPIVP